VVAEDLLQRLSGALVAHNYGTVRNLLRTTRRQSVSIAASGMRNLLVHGDLCGIDVAWPR